MKLGVIGDLHFQEQLAYADYIKDGREGEKQAVLDMVVTAFKDCDRIVFLGDNLDKKNNPSSAIRDFTRFIERFHDKRVYIIGGNHEKWGDGRSAIDYLKEIKKPNWKIITNEIYEEDGLVFCPHFFKSELGAETDAAGTAELLKRLPNGDILFHHHAVSDTLTDTESSTNLFGEIVFPKKEIETKYKLVVGGHIHKPGIYGKTIVAGSIFTSHMREIEKWVFIVSKDGVEDKILLPVRPIYKLENPTLADIAALQQGSIAKIILTERKPLEEIAKMKQIAEQVCDAVIVVENYPYERAKTHFDASKNFLALGVEDLLKQYAEQNKIDQATLIHGYNLII